MKKLSLCLVVAGVLLSACSSQLPLNANLNPALRAANTGVRAMNAPEAEQANPRIMETFKGYLNHSQYDNSGLAEMLMTARSLFGKTYDNRNSASRYYLYYHNQKDSLAEAIGPIRLGRDQGLYLEEMQFNQGVKRMTYYRLGSYQLPAGSKDGQEVAFQLDGSTRLKMKWRGINPMDHDELHLTIDPGVQPQEMPPSAFL